MKKLLIPILVLFCQFSFAQNQDSVRQAINQEVWYPFIKTYNGLDAAGFMALHTDDVIRINRDGKSIKIGPEYADSQQQSAARSKKRGSKRSISFSFTERFAREDIAFEAGYYKVEWAQGDKSGTSYGEFQVILKKENGRWKLFVDSDTSYEGQLTEEDFQKGELLK